MLAQVGLWRTLGVRLCSVAKEDLKEMLRITLTPRKKLVREEDFRLFGEHAADRGAGN